MDCGKPTGCARRNTNLNARSSTGAGCLLIALALLGLPVQSSAVGSGLPFLLLSSGARNAAMAEASTALPDMEAITYNPAALQGRGRGSVGLTHSEFFQGIRHEHFSLVFVPKRGVAGFSAQVSQAEGLERRTGPSAQPLGRFGVYNGVINMAYARAWNDKLRLGANFKLIRQSVYTSTATGAAMDFGVLYTIHPHMRVGAALRNLGRMSELNRSATRLPMQGRLGLTYAGFGPILLSVATHRAAGHPTTVHMGGESALGSRLVLRAGYQNTHHRKLTLGMGLRSSNWTLEYAFIPPFKSALGEAHRFALQLHRGG